MSKPTHTSTPIQINTKTPNTSSTLTINILKAKSISILSYLFAILPTHFPHPSHPKTSTIQQSDKNPSSQPNPKSIKTHK